MEWQAKRIKQVLKVTGKVPEVRRHEELFPYMFQREPGL